MGGIEEARRFRSEGSMFADEDELEGLNLLKDGVERGRNFDDVGDHHPLRDERISETWREGDAGSEEGAIEGEVLDGSKGEVRGVFEEGEERSELGSIPLHVSLLGQTNRFRRRRSDL